MAVLNGRSSREACRQNLLKGSRSSISNVGRHSSLSPIDPLYQGLPAHAILEEFNDAYKEVKAEPAKIVLWQHIIAKYHPTLLGECKKAIQWAEDIVKENLSKRMLAKDADKETKIEKILKEFADHATNLSHSRHISAEKCKELGLNVEMMEDDQALQDLVLTVHHCYMHTLSGAPALKIIENQNGASVCNLLRP